LQRASEPPWLQRRIDSTIRLFLSQPFEPFARRGKFRVKGKLEIINVAGSAEGNETIAEIVREGIFQHPKVATLWCQWEATDAA